MSGEVFSCARLSFFPPLPDSSAFSTRSSHLTLSLSTHPSLSISRPPSYLLNICAHIQPTAAGKLGSLAALDTAHPVLYIDFPCGGRLKMTGHLVFPKAKFLVLRAGGSGSGGSGGSGGGGVLVEDVLDCMVTFTRAAWVGRPEDNPAEEELPLPPGVLVGGGGSGDKVVVPPPPAAPACPYRRATRPSGPTS